MGQNQSWGRYPQLAPSRVDHVLWKSDKLDLKSLDRPVLPYGYGRSYGDSCQNQDGVLLDSHLLDRFLDFDERQGILRCEAGVSLDEVLKLIVPRGWFLPVTPGTKFVSVAGAVANDIHGKNHHSSGTFGRHVTSFELLRSNGERLVCTPTQNQDHFRSTIGGLGLTGLILCVEFRLKPIANPYMVKETIRFSNLKEFFELSDRSDDRYEYTVSWVDSLARGKSLGRGMFYRGNHAQKGQELLVPKIPRALASLFFDLPGALLNSLTMRMASTVLYRSQFWKKTTRLVHYDPFFYPLDSILQWNRAYGKKGFLQYQFCVPPHTEQLAIREVLDRASASGDGSFLNVLKRFGPLPSPGMMSFPRQGTTLAMDFAFKGQRTLDLLENLDQVVSQAGGAVYPAKDARMSAGHFQAFFPQWKEFSQFIDPKFSSSFWRRVTEGK